MITVGTDEEEVLAITRKQAKEYLDPAEEKRKFEEVCAEIEKASHVETSAEGHHRHFGEEFRGTKHSTENFADRGTSQDK